MVSFYQGHAPLHRHVEITEISDYDDAVPVTVVEPDGRARGGIIVLHQGLHLTEPLRDLMQAVAGEGWIVVVPNLFHRGADPMRERIFDKMLFADFDACHEWLIARGVNRDCVGVLGIDDAGTAAFLVAINRPVGAAVSIAAGGIVKELMPQAQDLVAAAPHLQAPWLGLFGTEDPDTSVVDIEDLADAVAAAPVATHIVRYRGLRHRVDRIDIDDLAGTDDESVEVKTRVFDWFDSFLR